MIEHLNKDNRIAGTIIFDGSIPLKKLEYLITNIKSYGEPNRWVDLHIRGAGDNGSHCLVFHYILENGKKKTHNRMSQKIIDYLKTELGVRLGNSKVPTGVKSWSISTVRAIV